MGRSRGVSHGLAGERRPAIGPGSVFGLWEVLGENPHCRYGKVLCRCACGKEKMVLVGNLVRGLSRGCGCAASVTPGMTKGNLIVTGHAWIDRKGKRRVRCRCACGRIFFPRTDDLLRDKVKSCGCLVFSHEFRRQMRDIAGRVMSDSPGKPC